MQGVQDHGKEKDLRAGGGGGVIQIDIGHTVHPTLWLEFSLTVILCIKNPLV